MPFDKIDRPKAGDVETRHTEVATEGRKIRGIVPFNVESRDLGGWRETISPTALRNAKIDNLIARVDHQGVPVARHPRTLEVEERNDGLHWAFTPPESRRDLVEAVERGDLQAGSWQMIVAKDRWEGDLRHVEQIAELRDVGPVSSPAYEAAAVEYRSRPTTTPADGPEETNTSMDEAKTEERSDAPDQAEERKAPDAKVTNEPAPVLAVEDRSEAPKFSSLAEAYEQKGFFENRTASLGWDEFRSFTWSGGTVLGDLNPTRVEGAPFGYDQRWLFPALPNVAVDASTTSVQFLRQSARTLAAGTAVIRPLDATTTKPETSSTAELVTQQLSQVATVQTGVPRIHAAQPIFQQIVEQDLRYAVNDGLDQLVRTGVNTAGTAAAVTGQPIDKVRKAITVVQAEGYNPSILAIDPAGAEALDLQKSEGSEKMYVFNAGAAAPAPYGLQVRIWKSAGTAVIDGASFGQFYVAPVELASFEADAGVSNKQNIRLETNATFAVQRTAAALRIV